MHHAGKIIQMARKAQNLSLRDLAALSEVDHTTISRIERGVIDGSPRTLKALTEALGRALGGAA
jgi:transcriptional regulator with XRE-family HTH domain